MTFRNLGLLKSYVFQRGPPGAVILVWSFLSEPRVSNYIKCALLLASILASKPALRQIPLSSIALVCLDRAIESTSSTSQWTLTNCGRRINSQQPSYDSNTHLQQSSSSLLLNKMDAGNKYKDPPASSSFHPSDQDQTKNPSSLFLTPRNK